MRGDILSLRLVFKITSCFKASWGELVILGLAADSWASELAPHRPRDIDRALKPAPNK